MAAASSPSSKGRQDERPQARPTRRPPAANNNLENPWKARRRPIAAQTPAKKAFVFNERKFGFPNFSKTIFGRIEENQRFAGEKIWKS
jgi:hypothetical protein